MGQQLGPKTGRLGMNRATLNKIGALWWWWWYCRAFSDRGRLLRARAYLHLIQWPNAWDDSRRRRHWASTSKWTEAEKCRIAAANAHSRQGTTDRWHDERPRSSWSRNRQRSPFKRTSVNTPQASSHQARQRHDVLRLQPLTRT